MFVRYRLVGITIVAAIGLGFVWARSGLPPWLLLPILVGLALLAAWALARQFDDKAMWAGACFALAVFYIVGGYMPVLLTAAAK
jgi:hypothetical protein